MEIPKVPSILSLPFIDDIREKGVVKASTDLADDAVTRVTSGMNISDIRSTMRGDAPVRPNPRLKPHAEGFWLHMKPTYYHNLVDGLYPTYRLGWLATFFFVWEIVTGIFLMIFYTPSPIVAYENMLNILSNVPFGRFMRDTHKLGGELMVLVVAFHMVRTYVTGSYKRPRQFTWATGALLLWLTLFVSFFGYLLPWDQLSLWAVTIGASAADACNRTMGRSPSKRRPRNRGQWTAPSLSIARCAHSAADGCLHRCALLQSRDPRPQPAARKGRAGCRYG